MLELLWIESQRGAGAGDAAYWQRDNAQTTDSRWREITLPGINPLSQNALRIRHAHLLTRANEYQLEIAVDGVSARRSFHFGVAMPLVFHG